MKKLIYQISIGSVLGIILAISVIIIKNPLEVGYGISNIHSLGNFNNSWVEETNILTLKDVFAFPHKEGHHLYRTIYDKLLVYPEKDSLHDVAQKYALTEQEAKAAIGGSASVLFNNPDQYDAKSLTQLQAKQLVENMQEEFNDLMALYELQQQIESTVTANEIFANGDVLDSGFDLIDDLNVMEEILFLDNSKTYAGDNYGDQLETPYLPTEVGLDGEPKLKEAGAKAIVSFGEKEGSLSDENVDKADAAGVNGALANGDVPSSEIPYLENPATVNAEISDSCPVDNSEFAGAIEELHDMQSKAVAGDKNQNDSGDIAGGKVDENVGDPGKADDPPEGKVGGALKFDEKGDLQPAVQEEEEKKLWCPGKAEDEGFLPSFAKMGLKSLAGDAYANLGEAGASAGAETIGFKASVDFCIDIEEIWKTNSAFYPGKGCILCEIEKMNTALNEALSHSLHPNKGTGTMLESAKCKDSSALLAPSLQLIAIAEPIPTPPTDDMLLGDNIFERWNKFVTRYSPLILPEAQDEFVENNLDFLGPDVTQSELYSAIKQQQKKSQSEALGNFDSYKTALQFSNTRTYSETVLMEIRMMHEYFKNYQKTFDQMDTEVCQKLLKKPNKD